MNRRTTPGQARARTRRPSGVVTCLAALLALLLVLTGCAQLPLTGPVGTAEPIGGAEAQPHYVFSPVGPAQDASPEEIVRGFIAAGTGVQDDYATAREFLTEAAAGQWNPSARTLVYSAQPLVVPTGAEESMSVQVQVDSVVDSTGLLTSMPENSTEAMDITLVKEEDQWRISSVMDGTLVESAQFRALFSAHSLYFYDPTFTYAVPDVRWFVNRPSTTAAIAGALLDGPAPYLAGAVTTAFPPGAELSQQSVPVAAGQAQVDLSVSAVEGTDPRQRQRMKEQMELTLQALSTVTGVDITVDGGTVDLGSEETEADPVRVDPSVGSTQVAVSQGQLVYFEGTSVLPVGGVPEVTALEPRNPSMNLAGTGFTFLSPDAGLLYSTTTEGRLTELVEGEQLTRASMDWLNWIWTVDHTDDVPQVLALPADGQGEGRRELTADWLAKRHVHALRISADGTRAAVVAGDAASASVFVAGVIRDSEGVPRGLGAPIRLQADVPVTDVDWYSDREVLVGAPSDSEPVELQILGVDGSSSTLKPLLGLLDFSAGAGPGPVYAVNEDAVWMRVGSNWRAQSELAQDLTYPG